MMDPEAIEGRLLAHRRALELVLRAVAARPEGRELEAALRERATLRDGQEDPGAVETPGLGIALAAADEFRLLAEALGPGADRESDAAT